MSENRSLEKQLLRDSGIKPTDETLAEILGGLNDVYSQFIAMLNVFDVVVQWRYYNDGKAWLAKGLYRWKSTRGADKEKTVFWLSIWDGFFKVNFYFAEKLQTSLQSLPVGAITKRKIEDAKPMGKLHFVPIIFDVRSDDLFADLGVLIDYKKSIK